MVLLSTMNLIVFFLGRVRDHHHLLSTAFQVPLLNTSISGLNTPRAASPSRPQLQRRASSQPPPAKSVQFDLSTPPSGLDSPAQIRKRRQRNGTSSQNDRNGYDSEGSTPRRDRHRRRSNNNEDAHSPSPASSESTIDLPERFDERGKRVPEANENPFAEKIQEAFRGKGSMGKMLKDLGLAGDGDDEHRDRDRDKRRRRR